MADDMLTPGVCAEHDAGAAALPGGRVVAHRERERVTRAGNQAGWLPGLHARGPGDARPNQPPGQEARGYRPFAPALPAEAFPRYFGEAVSPPAACVLDTCTSVPAHRGRFASASSPGAWARPQAVNARRSPRHHALLAARGKRMGHPVALDTSLNALGMTIARDLPRVVDDCVVRGVSAAWMGGVRVEGAALRAAAGTPARHPVAAAHAKGG